VAEFLLNRACAKVLDSMCDSLALQLFGSYWKLLLLSACSQWVEGFTLTGDILRMLACEMIRGYSYNQEGFNSDIIIH
jgi:hypothetical protein